MFLILNYFNFINVKYIKLGYIFQAVLFSKNNFNAFLEYIQKLIVYRKVNIHLSTCSLFRNKINSEQTYLSL